MDALRLHRLGFILVFFILPLIQAGTCDDDTSNPLDPEDQEFDTNVRLTAFLLPEECVHLFTPGESFPCCQVCRTGLAQGERTQAMHLVNGSSYVFRVGRNSMILAQKSCRVGGRHDDSYSVHFEAGVLSCQGGFR